MGPVARVREGRWCHLLYQPNVSSGCRSWFPTRREELDPKEPPALARLESFQPTYYNSKLFKCLRKPPGLRKQAQVLMYYCTQALHTGIDAFT